MRARRRTKNRAAPELDITAFLNLMVVLVPFLLVSAVFSRVVVLELNMPTGAGGAADDDAKVTVEVVVRESGLEISDGTQVIRSMPRLSNEQLVDPSAIETEVVTEQSVLATTDVYDLKKLREYLLQIKNTYPEKTDAIILMEETIAYQHLVAVMDAMRGVELAAEVTDEVESVGELSETYFVLFPDISIGDAP